MGENIYFKITNEDNINEDLLSIYYQPGLNICPIGFNDTAYRPMTNDIYIYSRCKGDGFYFCTKEFVDNFYSYGSILWTVELPVDDPDFQRINDFKANRIILKEKYLLSDIETYLKFNLPIPTVSHCNNMNYLSIIKYLIDHLNYSVENIISDCLNSPKLEIIKYLVENYKNNIKFDNKLVEKCIGYGNFKLFKYIFDNFCDIDINQCLKYSIRYDKLKIVKYLVENGADINLVDGNVIKSCPFGRCLNIFKYLIENGVDLAEGKYYAMSGALSCGNIDIIKFFINHGIDITNDRCQWELVQALVHGRIEMTQFLFSLDINFDQKWLDNALRCACREGDIEKVKYFIKMGVDFRSDNDEALKIACESGSMKIVKYLVELGADVTSYESSALTIACGNGDLGLVEYLVTCGADIQAGKNRPLRRACKNGYLGVVKYLVQMGANIHAKNDNASVKASQKGHVDIVKYLVQLGAGGMDAIGEAYLNGHNEIVEYFISQGYLPPVNYVPPQIIVDF